MEVVLGDCVDNPLGGNIVRSKVATGVAVAFDGVGLMIVVMLDDI